MKTASSRGMRSSAGCRYGVGTYIHSAQTGAVEGQLLYRLSYVEMIRASPPDYVPP